MNMNMNIVKQLFISFRDQRLSIRIHFKNQKLDEPEIRVSLNIHTYIITTTLIPIRSIPLLSPPLSLYTSTLYQKPVYACMHAGRHPFLFPLGSKTTQHYTQLLFSESLQISHIYIYLIPKSRFLIL